MAYGIGYIFRTVHFSCSESLRIIYVFFGIFRYKSHCLYRFHRVHSRGGFSGKHYCAGSIVNGVCHIGSLCSGGSWIFYHAFKHLCGRNNLLAGVVALFDKHLLKLRYVFKGDFHAHVASRHHYSVGYS